jgi:bifunctional non-homologous end joining protein LigD
MVFDFSPPTSYFVSVSLNEYRAKRDFTKTPEPSGAAAPRRGSTKTRFFCVQKHLATQLHYDLRLEHDGVLLSWAVPKGPSLDPALKRLAMQTEDHPIDYGEFEGVIPEGYGAGVVMLWDRGTWEPEVEDVAAALRKGDLKIRLHGYKLKGSWALVRTRGYGGSGRSWLLIKHRDEWAGELDITAFAPLSVKSEGSFADILGREAPEVWTSHRREGTSGTLESLQKIVEKVERYERERTSTRRAPATASASPRGTRARPAASAAGQGAAGKPARATKKAEASASAGAGRKAKKPPAAKKR